MKAKWMLLVPFLVPAYSQDMGSSGVPMVREAHDRMMHFARDKQDSECNEQHNLKPDGDSDCDDSGPKVGIPEPASLLLLLTGLGGLWLTRRR